jgi:hypothetical protein
MDFKINESYHKINHMFPLIHQKVSISLYNIVVKLTSKVDPRQGTCYKSGGSSFNFFF